jgi:hypothetical protein
MSLVGFQLRFYLITKFRSRCSRDGVRRFHLMAFNSSHMSDSSRFPCSGVTYNANVSEFGGGILSDFELNELFAIANDDYLPNQENLRP